MRTILRTYSHPVLGNSDDFSSKFDVDSKIEVSDDGESWLIEIKTEMDNSYLQKLIDTGEATFHIEVECRSTFYRQSFSTLEDITRFEISTTRLRGRVKLDTFIVATKSISNYKPNGIHEDYGARSYQISAGEILGVGGTTTFIADTDFDPLRASANSFIKIERGRVTKGNIEVLHGSNDIIIRMPQQDYDRFQEVAGERLFEDILHASIVFPVLVEAVQFAQKVNHSDANDRLRAILEQRNLIKDDPFSVAQQILHSPVSRTLDKLHMIKETQS